MSERMWISEQLEQARTERDQARLELAALRAERAKATQSDNVLYLTQLRASAHDQAGKDGYTWISPEHVLNLLNLIEDQRITIASIRAEGSAERAKLEAALEHSRALLRWIADGSNPRSKPSSPQPAESGATSKEGRSYGWPPRNWTL